MLELTELTIQLFLQFMFMFTTHHWEQEELLSAASGCWSRKSWDGNCSWSLQFWVKNLEGRCRQKEMKRRRAKRRRRRRRRGRLRLSPARSPQLSIIQIVQIHNFMIYHNIPILQVITVLQFQCLHHVKIMQIVHILSSQLIVGSCKLAERLKWIACQQHLGSPSVKPFHVTLLANYCWCRN